MSLLPGDLDCQSTRFIEQVLEQYSRDPTSVATEWRTYFRQQHLEPTTSATPNAQHDGHRSSIPRICAVHSPRARDAPEALPDSSPFSHTQARIDQLVHAYRVRGHLAAEVDPLGLRRNIPEELCTATYGIQEQELDRPCSSIMVGGPDDQTLRAVIKRLENTYCRYIGAQFMHIDDAETRRWLWERMEVSENHLELSRDEQLHVLKRLTDAVTFESFVRKKYVGAKTFSLEGAETLIPLLDLVIHKAASQGVASIVLGMANRGRLNVLANVIGKRPYEIFYEFEDVDAERLRGRGDVKYHLGYRGTFTTRDRRQVDLSLCFNPSHLEFVNPVALGRTRRQDRTQDTERRHHLSLLIHGDASFAAEGIVQEMLNLSQLAAYRTGGTLHVIVNNQLGFTTPTSEAHSTTYATDVAKMLQIPIFHVNGEHPEAVAQVIELAMDFRNKYQRDAVIDMYCYRRWGHNEADEPSFTQPIMYRAIEHRESIRDSYLEHLLDLGGITRGEANEIASESYQRLSTEFDRAHQHSQHAGQRRADGDLDQFSWRSGTRRR